MYCLATDAAVSQPRVFRCLGRPHSDSLSILIMTKIMSADDFNFHLMIPLNVAAKRMGIDWNFHDGTIFPVGTMARSEREG